MSRELVEGLRKRASTRNGAAPHGVSDDDYDTMGYYSLGDVIFDKKVADTIERQDILIKEMAATLQNMALSLSNEDAEE